MMNIFFIWVVEEKFREIEINKYIGVDCVIFSMNKKRKYFSV